MYHYVQDRDKTNYPGLKGLWLDEFRGQLDYIKRHYTVVTADDLIAAIKDKAKLPENAALLTFDDGYADHYRNVFPVLLDLNLTGLFFPPGKTTLESRVLDVNKIHFVLATANDKRSVYSDLTTMIEVERERYGLEDLSAYQQLYHTPGRFDGPDVAFIKSMLQKGLPADCRTQFIDDLFQKYVTSDEAEFSSDIYMSLEQLQEMRKKGMYIGSHGYDHFWLSHLSSEQQKIEIEESLRFLERVGTPTTDWIMCYPYGDYNDSLLHTLRDNKCIVGLTTHTDVANIDQHDPLLLPRLDTNDLPKDGTAPQNQWTKGDKAQPPSLFN